MFAILFAIIDLGQIEFNDESTIRDTITSKTYAGIEYKYIDRLIAQFLSVIRISIGDFTFDQATQLNQF